MAEEQVSMAVQGTLLDENGNPLYTNTRSELVWVRVDSNGIPIPVTPTTPYEAGRDSELHTLLQKVVYTVTDQTIGGNKSFTGTTTTADVKPDGTNRNLGTPDLRYAKVYGSEINGATGTFSGNVSVGGTLGVTGATTLSSTLGVTGATTLNSTLNAKGATTLESTLGVSGKATLSDELEVAKATTLKSTLGVTGKTTLSDALDVSGATSLKSTLAVTGLITANGGIRVAKDKSYTIVDSSSKELTAITSKNASEVSLGVNTTNVSVGIYYGSTRKALVNGDGLTGANVIHSAGYAFKGKVVNDNTLYEMMKMTAAKKMNVGSSNIDEIDGVIGGNVVTVTNAKGIYSNGGVAAMGIIDAGTGGGSVGKLADCSDIDKIEDGGENYVKRTEVSGTNNWKAQQGDVLYAYGEGVFKAKPLFDNNGKILVSTLPDSLLGQVLYGGNFNASGVCTLTNSFKAKYGTESLTITSTNASAYEGVFFIASASGTVAGKAVETGDWLISDGSAWQKVDNNDAVTGVKGDSETVYRTGQINITKANIGLGNVENTALSTWAGTANITTLGTITTGTWNGSKISDAYISSAATWNSKYKKPDGGIPKSDLASGVQTSLEKADSALQSHQTIYGLTIKHNGTSLGTYTPNSEAKTIEITTPTALSGFSDDATHRLVTDTQIAAWNAKWDYNENTIKAVKVTNAGNADTLESHGASYFATASGLTTANGNITTLQGYFTDGIAKKATADASGNTITSTYATKTERANADITAVSLTASKLTLTRADGNLEVNVPTWNQNTTGNAATATALAREVLDDLNNGTKYRFFESANNNVDNTPTVNWVNGITFAMNNNSDYRTQLVLDGRGFLHTRYESGKTWYPWHTIYDSANTNKTTVDWSAKNLTLAGSITGATSGAFSGNVTIGGTLGVTGATTLAGLTTQTIKPNTTDTYTLGDADHRWKEAHIAKTIGDLQGNADTATTADKTKEVEGTFVDEVFSEKVIADAYEVAEVESLKGNTIVANQLVNTLGDTLYGTLTFSNGIYTIKKTATNSSYVAIYFNGRKFYYKNGHKYVLGIFNVVGRQNFGDAVYFQSMSGSYNQQLRFNNGTTFGLYTHTKSDELGAIIFGTDNSESTPSMSFSRVSIFDLTQMGIADKVTTIEDFYALCPWAKNPVAYNEGQLVNFTADAIVSKGGVNLWDEQWEHGYFDDTTGAFISDDVVIRSKNFIRVLPGQKLVSSNSLVYALYFFNSNGGYISFVPTAGNPSITVPTNAAFCKFRCVRAYGGTYNHDICISVSNPATNGKYFPYEESKRKVAVTELRSKGGEIIFPDGMKKAGDVYDEIVGNKAKKRMKYTDCTNLNFTLQSINSYGIANFQVALTDRETAGDNKNIISSESLQNTLISETKTEGVFVNNTNYLFLRVKSSTASTPDELSAYLKSRKSSGRPLSVIYELATPIEYELDSDIDIVYPATQGSEISLEVDGIDAGERAKYGVVDLGSLEWQRSSVGGGRFYIDRDTFSQQLPLAKQGGAIYCDSYTTYNGAVNINAADMNDRSLYSYINGNLYQPLCIRDTRVNSNRELKDILKGVKLYFELAAGATPVTAPLNARVGYYTNGRKALRNVIGSMDKWSKTLNFGHVNADGAWVDDYEFNHTSDINIPIVKANFSAKGTDTDNKQLLLVKDADGNGYVVAKIGYRPTGTVSPIKTN